MALVPIISQTWDTNSVFNPTRMNNIEQNIATVSKATGVEYSTGVSVKDKLDEIVPSNYKIEVGQYPITYGNQTGSILGIKLTVVGNGRYMIIGTELSGGTLGGGSFVYNSWIDSTVRFAI